MDLEEFAHQVAIILSSRTREEVIEELPSVVPLTIPKICPDEPEPEEEGQLDPRAR